MCSCGDAPSVFSDKIVVARKAHRCSECRHTIKPGERYEQFDGCWDGRWDHYKTCETCLEIREQVMNHEDCFRFTEVWQMAEDMEIAYLVKMRLPRRLIFNPDPPHPRASKDKTSG